MFNSKIVPSGWWMGLRRIGKGRRLQWDVVLHCPQPLFLRPEAPRLSGRMGLRRLGRGTSPPAKPYSFVRKHHVCRTGWAAGGWDVVLHHPQTLVPSSGSTTSVSPDGMRWETARPFPFLSTHKERNSAGREARCCSFIIHIFSKKRKNRRLPNFPGSFPPSIFSAGELNFCVRDGNRCILSAIITGFSLFNILKAVPSKLNNIYWPSKPSGQVLDRLVPVS